MRPGTLEIDLVKQGEYENHPVKRAHDPQTNAGRGDLERNRECRSDEHQADVRLDSVNPQRAAILGGCGGQLAAGQPGGLQIEGLVALRADAPGQPTESAMAVRAIVWRIARDALARIVLIIDRRRPGAMLKTRHGHGRLVDRRGDVVILLGWSVIWEWRR